MQNILISVFMFLPGAVVALGAWFIMRRRFSLWRSLLFGSLLIIVLTVAAIFASIPMINADIAACQAAPPGTTVDCEDAGLLVGVIAIFGMASLAAHVLLSFIARLLAAPG